MPSLADYISPKNLERLAFVGQVYQVGSAFRSLITLHPLDFAFNLALGLYLEKGLVVGFNVAQSVFKNTQFGAESKKYGAYISANYSSISKLSDIVSAKVGEVIQNSDGYLKDTIARNMPKPKK